MENGSKLTKSFESAADAAIFHAPRYETPSSISQVAEARTIRGSECRQGELNDTQAIS